MIIKTALILTCLPYFRPSNISMFLKKLGQFGLNNVV